MAQKSPKNPILAALREASQDEAKAVAFLEANRWGSDPACPKCGSVAVYQMTGKDGAREKHYRWRCRDCKKMYSVRTGLVLEESRLPLRVWVYVLWKTCASKKGVSALQISRECEISYKSALFLMHRIRYAMTDENPPKLSGTIEVDETWIGGKPRHPRRIKNRPVPLRPFTGEWTKKTPVMALVQRDGNVRVRKIERVDAVTLGGAIAECVEAGSTVYTDEHAAYKHLSREGWNHDSVNHRAAEYARGDVTTNTVEGFFSLLKRGVYGTFHSVSKHHLHRYLSEFSSAGTRASWTTARARSLRFAGPKVSVFCMRDLRRKRVRVPARMPEQLRLDF